MTEPEPPSLSREFLEPLDGRSTGVGDGSSPNDDHSDAAAAAATTTTTINNNNLRTGTTGSARFNILSTMVGGGSLSLPFAFQKSGNGFIAPILLIIIALLTEFCFRILVASARSIAILSNQHHHPISTSNSMAVVPPGHDSFESIAAIAFGPKAYRFCTVLVTAMCFFGIVAYAVLLRDMLQPITNAIFPPMVLLISSDRGMSVDIMAGDSISSTAGPTWSNNISMFLVVFLVTPLCTLQTLTALKRFGAASMVSVFILGSCILFRSVQCNIQHPYHDPLLLSHVEGDNNNNSSSSKHWWEMFSLLPSSWKDLLDAFPIFVSCFVCHYNILPVHNEFRHPTKDRVGWWLRSTTWIAASFYMIMGLAGSAYGPCTPTGHVQGNVLLDFAPNDPLLLVGRMCLAITITLAFPMLTLPARDIIIRSVQGSSLQSMIPSFTSSSSSSSRTTNGTTTPIDPDHLSNRDELALREPLLDHHDGPIPEDNCVTEDHRMPRVNSTTGITATTPPLITSEPSSFMMRLTIAILVLWSAAILASCVSSIAIVWDLLGSSLSILLSYLIPCGSYIVIKHRQRHSLTHHHDNNNDDDNNHWKERLSMILAWGIIVVFVPLMIISTTNAIYNTFFH